MDSHDLVEMTTGLASRVNNLAVQTAGTASRTLMSQQDQLAKLAMAAIVQDLDAGQADYQNAVNLLSNAIAQVDTALQKTAEVTKAIDLIAQALASVSKVLG